jgi:hypothetical protein
MLSKKVVSWGERVLALGLVMLGMAVVIPNCFVRIRSASGGSGATRRLALTPVMIFGLVGLALLTCIVVGQSRSRALRMAGWALLIVYVLFTAKVV